MAFHKPMLPAIDGFTVHGALSKTVALSSEGRRRWSWCVDTDKGASLRSSCSRCILLLGCTSCSGCLKSKSFSSSVVTADSVVFAGLLAVPGCCAARLSMRLGTLAAAASGGGTTAGGVADPFVLAAGAGGGGIDSAVCGAAALLAVKRDFLSRESSKSTV